jgi:hypothetical protein
MTQTRGPVISVMLAVADTPTAVDWYRVLSVLRNCGAWDGWPAWRLRVQLSSWVSRPRTAGKAARSLVSLPLG